MFTKAFILTYLKYGLIAAVVYCITVVIFLSKQQFQSIWVLYLGNALYLLTIVVLVYFYNKQQQFTSSTIASAISGHILSVTGAVLSVIISLLLYFLFASGLLDGKPGEALQQAPSAMRNGNAQGMVFVLLVNAALGNTVSGFFAAVITSFSVKRNQTSEKKP